MDATD
jgi:DNA (cytosine-5)-methyltransferase 1